ncbi:hypothetical protein GXW83_02850 [Streptacidiphilus sp. PB12-B1b]|uniref:beta strand repeat-containing protein n=1 Tax=Streptacidiphilus sp. PB12-B1b TaxID=2705012 RepID=UPI0015F98647|nr:hypothetical protein [Streptacidiphilus sp. PB12-B1b]QMU74867.1 hypothetical protein GXW83_02850 [Streptacidiphilus sp. PB12-B1b]
MTMHHRKLRPGAAAVAVFLAATALVQAAPAGAATPMSAPPTPRIAHAATDAPMGYMSNSVSDQTTSDSDADDPTAQALQQAAATGEPVTVDALTDTGTLVQANPDGTLTRTVNSMPQRVEQNGTWVPINTTLSLKNGMLAPSATVTGVTFSPGDTTSMATLETGPDSLGFTWPTALPAPVVTGSTATYPNVFPDVDLQLTADASGYSSMLVLKTASAASDPQLQSLSLGTVTKHVTLSTTQDGGAQAVDTSTKQVVFHSDTALMWDSSGTGDTASTTPAASSSASTTRAHSTASRAAAAPAAVSRVAAAEAEIQSAQHVGSHQARIGVSLQNGRQVLSLNKDLLKAKTTRYPVFVDPEWGGPTTKLDWARISDNGDNVYNSTATSGDANAREGWDNDNPGNGERARTYYQMDTAGVIGAHVFTATLSVTQLSAASCSATPATVYGTTYPGGWNSSSLYWGHEPTIQTGELGTPPTSEEAGVCPVTNGTGSYVSPPDLSFNVLSRVQSAAQGGWNSMTLMVQSVNMNDATQWKELGYGGGASLSITYSFPPQLTNGTGAPKITPVATDFGQNVTWNNTPKLSATAYEHSGDTDLVVMDYHVYNSAGTQVAYAVNSTYTAHGLPYTVPSLPDGTYTWKATAENKSGLWVGTGAGVWTPTQTFTINTSAPAPPTVSSPQFPVGQIGAAYDTRGTFTFGNNHSNTVAGYMFSLDNDLSNSSYTTSVPKLTSSTNITSGTTYFASADNANGTGAGVTNGTATLGITIPDIGSHTVYVKAVNNAGTSSAETSYLFYAGATAPTYAYGDKMVTGYTATNTDSTTTAVPAATTTSIGGHLITQPQSTGLTLADGAQGMLANNTSAGTKVASGDSATFSFDVPSTGSWDIGASLTKSSDFGSYNLVLDAGGTQPAQMTTTPFDAYSPFATTTYVDFGFPEDNSGTPITLSEGVHTITLTLTGQDPASTGIQAGIDVLRLSPVLTCTINDTSGCRNNTAFSTYTASPAKVTTANADGWGYSFNQSDLSALGWPINNGVAGPDGSGTSGNVTVDGASIALPNLGTGQHDNMLASGQTVTVPANTPGVVNSGNALVFLAFSTTGNVTGVTGKLTYQASKSCTAGQNYTLDTVPDWAEGLAGTAAVTLPNRNASNNTQSTTPLHIYAISVPLQCSGTPVASISLPVQTNGVQGGFKSLHILGLGIRPSSNSWDSNSNLTSHYTGTWEAANDTSAISNNTGTTAAVADQTLRIPAKVSIGTDSNSLVRVHLSNATGTSPVTVNAASIALQDPTALGANTTGTITPITFNGNASITLPAGTDAVSDPLTLALQSQATVLVSLDINASMSQMSGHGKAQTPIYTSAGGNGNATQDTGGGYKLSAISGIPYLNGLDVSTLADNVIPGALVLYGDQSVNSDTASSNGTSLLSDDIANALVTNQNGDQQVDYGILNAGTNSSSPSNNLIPAAAAPAPGNAANPVDRSVLEQANVHTVLISTGTSDLLACPSSDTVAICASGVETKLGQLASEITSYYEDDDNQSSTAVYIATIPPGATPMTGMLEQARETVNADLLSNTAPSTQCGTTSPGSNIGAQGIIDFASAVSTDGSATDAGSNTVKTADLANGYPDNQYYQDLATAYMTDSNTSCMVETSPN